MSFNHLLHFLVNNDQLDLASIGSSLGFEGELIWAGLDISSGLVNRLLIIMEGQRGLKRC